MSSFANELGGLTGAQATALNSFLALGNTAAGFHLAKSGGVFVVTADSAGGGGTPGGATTQLQYNNAGAFGGITGATTDGTKLIVTSTGFEIADITTSTKKAVFNVASISAATTRTLTVQNSDGTLALLSNNLGQFGSTTSAQLSSVLSDKTGTGVAVFATSPTLVTPTLGVALATSVNGLVISTTTGTLTLTNAKTLAVTNSLTLSGTDATVMTFPTTSATIARTDAAQTFTGVQTFANAINEKQGADIASAGTTDIGAATGNYVNVTGTTTITALGTVQAGTRRIVNFTGALTLTYNATSLILPTSANITTAAGDTATFVSLGSGNWKCVNYDRASGASLVGGSGGGYVNSTPTSKDYTYTVPCGHSSDWVSSGVTMATTTNSFPHSIFRSINNGGSGYAYFSGSTTAVGTWNLPILDSSAASSYTPTSVLLKFIFIPRPWGGSGGGDFSIGIAETPSIFHFGGNNFIKFYMSSTTQTQITTSTQWLGSPTTNVLSVATTTGVPIELAIKWKVGSIEFYAAGNLISTHTTNIPPTLSNANMDSLKYFSLGGTSGVGNSPCYIVSPTVTVEY